MNRKDLKDYKYTQDWIKDQEEYIQNQMETERPRRVHTKSNGNCQ